MFHYKKKIITLFFLSFLVLYNNKVLSNTLSVSIQKESIIYQFSAKIAKTKKDIEKGLMFVETIDAFEGMLFFFSENKIANFWMKNTKIFLDLIFINEEKTIIKIIKNVRPLSEKIYSSGIPVRYVLEIKGGMSEKLKIKTGDILNFEEL